MSRLPVYKQTSLCPPVLPPFTLLATYCFNICASSALLQYMCQQCTASIYVPAVHCFNICASSALLQYMCQQYTASIYVPAVHCFNICASCAGQLNKTKRIIHHLVEMLSIPMLLKPTGLWSRVPCYTYWYKQGQLEKTIMLYRFECVWSHTNWTSLFSMFTCKIFLLVSSLRDMNM